MPSSSKNSCSSTSTTPTPASPPATQIARPRERCVLANEVAQGRTSCKKTCCPRFPGGRRTWSTCDNGVSSLSPGPDAAPFELVGAGWRVLLSSIGASDSSTMINAASAIVPDGLGTRAERSRGRSAREQSRTRPPTFITGVGVELQTPPPLSTSSRGVTSTNRATSVSRPARGHASSSARCRQNISGVRPYKVKV